MENTRKISPAVAAIIVIVLIGLIAAGTIALSNKPSAEKPASTSSSDQGNSTTSTSTSYKDGTYDATGKYSTPGGTEFIDLKVTLSKDLISSTSLTEKGLTSEAKQFQASFSSGYKSLVIGKKVSEVSLTRVAGSSLTSNGFNDALDQIKIDASK
ncbi:hypothetical protein H7X68_00130 [Candidatus Saccharibacteria bacterium]|nr:hypothetical protein [Candidatus Saccharibacteria bacterium]